MKNKLSIRLVIIFVLFTVGISVFSIGIIHTHRVSQFQRILTETTETGIIAFGDELDITDESYKRAEDLLNSEFSILNYETFDKKYEHSYLTCDSIEKESYMDHDGHYFCVIDSNYGNEYVLNTKDFPYLYSTLLNNADTNFNTGNRIIYRIPEVHNFYILVSVLDNQLLPGMNDSQFIIECISILVAIAIIVFVFVWYMNANLVYPLYDLAEDIQKIDIHDPQSKLPEYSNTEINRIGSSFNHVKNELDKTLDNYSAFISDVTHGLKTPIATMKLLVDKTLNSDDLISNETGETMLKISKLIDSESKTINDLAMLAKYNDMGMFKEFKVIDISVILTELIDATMCIFEDKEAILETNIENEVFVNGNSKDITILFENIIDNSYKHINNNSTIKVSLIKDSNKCRIEFYDNGTGIDKEDLPYIFDRYYKVDDKGTGLGLAICKAIVESMNGSITADSVSGQWTKITIIIPLAATDNI